MRLKSMRCVLVGGVLVMTQMRERERELEILEKIYCETRASRVDDRCMNISRIFFDACLPSTHYTLGGERHCGGKKCVCVGRCPIRGPVPGVWLKICRGKSVEPKNLVGGEER
jgi:hypothetical protein